MLAALQSRIHGASRARAFSMIELVIVVVIIGIIGAIAIPRMSRGAAGAADSALVADLAVLRNAIDLYEAEHGGDYPALATFEAQLTQFTSAVGATSATKDATHIYGPYMQQAPTNPFTGGATVAADNSGDWEYTAATGAIRAVLPAAKITELNLSATDAVAAP